MAVPGVESFVSLGKRKPWGKYISIIIREGYVGTRKRCRGAWGLRFEGEWWAIALASRRKANSILGIKRREGSLGQASLAQPPLVVPRERVPSFEACNRNR